MERTYIYEQATGELLDDALTVVGKGYAGRGNGKNEPAMQTTKGVGPLPRGMYTAREPIDHPRVGKYALELVPDPSNEMYGRSEFFIHGDSKEHPGEASDGCIVMPLEVRQKFWAEAWNHRLQVTHG